MRYACGLVINYSVGSTLTQNTFTVDQAIELAASYMQSGNYEQATSLCTQILQAVPNDADALHFLGLMAANQGRPAEALPLLSRAVAARPVDFELHNNLGNLYKLQNDPESARQCYMQCIALNDQCCPAFCNLGLVLTALGRRDEAVMAYRNAIAIEPEFTQAHVNLALVLRDLGQFSAAVEHFKKAIAGQPDYVEAYVGLADMLAHLGNLDEAIQMYGQALQLRNDHAPLHNNLGVALTGQGKYTEARSAFEQALQHDPSFTEARNNLGVVQRLLGNWQGAIESFQAAIKENRHYSEAYRNLGQCLADRGEYQNAVLAYLQALEINPVYYEAFVELAVCYASMGENSEALRQFSAAQALNPSSIVPVWGSCMASLPNFYDSESEIAIARQRFSDALDDLRAVLNLSDPPSVADAIIAVGLLQPFFLTYQGLNNRELQMRYGRLICDVMAAGYPEFTKPLSPPALADNETVRIGIVSRHFSNHSDWKILINGLVQGLDRKNFRTYGYSTGGLQDEITEVAQKGMDSFTQGLGFEQLLRKIKDDDLHVLLFPEIGMDPQTLKLAALRLAPIQCASWARPETSGLPTIDYFLGSDLMEPANAQEHYSEKLVRLPNLFSYYVPPVVAADPASLEKFALAPDAIRYLCVQSLFKYLPQHDCVFPLIAKQVPNAQFIFVAKPAEISARLEERLHHTFAEHGLDSKLYVTFLPMLSHREFAGLLDSAHIFLDSIEYSGCLTTLEALEHCLPVVTMDGALMRGRQSKAMLGMIGMKETVAENIEQYVKIAVGLALDETWRSHLAAEIDSKRYWLYRDYETINALQNFLLKLVRENRN